MIRVSQKRNSPIRHGISTKIKMATNLFSKINWKSTIIASSIAAILFSICAGVYISKADYVDSWILYLGSVLFFFSTAYFITVTSRQRGWNESTISLVFAAQVATMLGILISVVLSLLLLLIMTPHFILPGTAEKELINAPASQFKGATDGLVFKVLFAATVANFCGGSIAGVTIPFYSKRNQMKDNREPTPMQQKDQTYLRHEHSAN